MKIYNSGGMERSVASTRELRATRFRPIVERGPLYVAEQELTDNVLRKASKTYANGDSDNSLNPGQFVRGVTKAARMDINLPVFTRISVARLALKSFLKQSIILS